MLAVTLLVSSFVIFSALYHRARQPDRHALRRPFAAARGVTILEQRYHLERAVPGPLLGTGCTAPCTATWEYSITLHENVSTLIARAHRHHARAGALRVAADRRDGRRAGRPRRRCGAGAVDSGVVVVTTISAAIPSFVAAIVLITVFAVNLGWFPAQGNGWRPARPDRAPDAAGDRAGDRARLALVARVTRAAVREEMRQGARADGHQPRHPLRARSSAATCCETRPSRSPPSPA